MQAAVGDARIAEISIGEAATVDNTLLAEQVSQMKNDLQKLAQRYDSIALTAPVQEGQRPPSQAPIRRVTFQDPSGGQEPRNRGRSPSPSPQNYGYPPSQNRGTYRPPFRGRGGRPRGNNFRGASNMQQRPFFSGESMPNGNQRCNKCGLAPHSNVMYCRAVNQQCLYCGRFGHFKRCCRSIKTD